MTSVMDRFTNLFNVAIQTEIDFPIDYLVTLPGVRSVGTGDRSGIEREGAPPIGLSRIGELQARQAAAKSIAK